MRWLKKDIWKIAVPLAGLILFLLLMVWVPVSANAYEGTSGLAITGQVQATSTEDATVTALQKEQLTQQVRQLDNWWLYWLYNGSTAFIAAITAIVVASIGLYQWRGNQNAERKKEVAAHDKDLRAQAEERFKTAVAALGDDNEATQVGGAILLRSFLNPDDKEIYGRYYTQIFDLAVAYLRLPSTPTPSVNPIAFFSLTPLRKALIVVFKEAFPLARDRLKEQDPKNQFNPQSLDATGIELSSAYLAGADLKKAEIFGAILRGAILELADLREADLGGADLREAHLSCADLTGTSLFGANLRGADLRGAHLNGTALFKADLQKTDLRETDLSEAILHEANFSGANLRGAILGEANFKDVLSLKDADLHGVKGLSKTQLATCKAKGAIIDEDTTASASQPIVAPPTSSQSTNTQAPSASPIQVTTPPASRDGSSNTSSQPNAEP